jgi:hypothetical protein
MPNDHQYSGWAKKKLAADYAGVGLRTFHNWLKDGLRYVRLPSGTILTKYSWIDEFLGQYEVDENVIEQVVEELLNK